MEINLNRTGLGGIGMGQVDMGHETQVASQASRHTVFHVSNQPSRAATSGLASAEPVAVVPDAALSRDDELGRLVNAAFNLPTPPMPNFSD